MRTVYIVLFVAAVAWLFYNWRKKTDLKIPVSAVVGTLIMNIFPQIAWLLMVGALGWLGFSVYKKKNKKLPAIASVVALALVIFMPSGGGIAGVNSIQRTGSRDFSSAEKVEAYFQAALDRNYPDAELRQVSSASWTTLYYNSKAIEGYYLVTQMVPSVEDRAAGHDVESFKYFVTKDGKIFDAADFSDLRLLD